MSANTFTFFGKFSDALSMLDDNDRRNLLDAIYLYGAWGEEPELDGIPAVVFAAIREDIENSVKSRNQGAKGGRPKTARSTKDRGDETNVGSETTTEPPSETPSETHLGNPPRKPPCETHTKPYQAIPVPTRPKSERGARERFTRPGRSEVEAYAHEIGLPPGEVPKWFDHYDACGWVVGRNKPMRDWKAALRNWKARLHEFSGKEATERDRYSEL